MSEPEVHGPIDFILIEFPGERVPDRPADEVLRAIDRGLIRLYDIHLIRKAADGSFESVDLHAAPAGEIGAFAALAGGRSGIIGNEDLASAADAMDPGTIGVLAVFENTWAVPLVAAAYEAKGSVIAGSRIPAQTVIEALNELEEE